MDQCKPGSLNPQRQKIIVDIGSRTEVLYNLRRSPDMPNWADLLANAKSGMERITREKTGSQSGGALTRKQVAAMVILFFLIVVVTIGILVNEGIQNPPTLVNQLIGEGCNDIAYDAYLRVIGVPLYPGCAVYHGARNRLLSMITGQRQTLVADDTLSITGLINTLVGMLCAGGTLSVFYTQLLRTDDQNTDSGPSDDLPPPPPYPKDDFDDGGDKDTGQGAIANGGKRCRTRRSYKKVNKTRRRKSNSCHRRYIRK